MIDLPDGSDTICIKHPGPGFAFYPGRIYKYKIYNKI